MVEQQASKDGLSPRLRPVLSSLSVNLESELNRYRRNRLTQAPSSEDVFADLEAGAFDIDVTNLTPTPPYPTFPPPVPPNRRLTTPDGDRPKAPPLAAQLPSFAPIDNDDPADNGTEDPSVARSTDSFESPSFDPTAVVPGSIVNVTAVQTGDASTGDNDGSGFGAGGAAANRAPSGYLESSEKLIASLNDVPPMPDPVDISPKPKRKTVSLLVGATLGLFGLVTGLGVSYLLSTPSLMQRLAGFFKGEDETAVVASSETFDPPGPDLSQREFVDLEIDNLSSLQMSSDPLDPAANPNGQALPGLPPGNQLPPIEGQSIPNPPASGEIQAAIVPSGVTYYVTVPFTTQQDLIDVRQSVEEAFVRSFSDGNRIQIAAFDNPQDAQQFVSDMNAQGITAFVYGPTTE